MSQVRALLAAHSFRACSLVRLERSAHNRVAAGSNPARPMLATEDWDALDFDMVMDLKHIAIFSCM